MVGPGALPPLSVSGLCRARRSLGFGASGALCLGCRRSLYRGPALSVSGPGALCALFVSRFGASVSVSGPQRCALCGTVGPHRSLAVCVGARRSLCRGPVSLCQGSGPLCRAPALSVSEPGTLCVGAASSDRYLSGLGPDGWHYLDRSSAEVIHVMCHPSGPRAPPQIRQPHPAPGSHPHPDPRGTHSVPLTRATHPGPRPPASIRVPPIQSAGPQLPQPGAFPFSRREPQTLLFGGKVLLCQTLQPDNVYLGRHYSPRVALATFRHAVPQLQATSGFLRPRPSLHSLLFVGVRGRQELFKVQGIGTLTSQLPDKPRLGKSGFFMRTRYCMNQDHK